MSAGPLDDAIAAFNRAEYFKAAEQFETVARDLDAELKDLAGALNRVAAALHLRFERGGRQGPINLISQAMLTLEDMRPACAGIDIARLFDELHAFTEDVRSSPRDEREGLRHRARVFMERRRAPKIERIK